MVSTITRDGVTFASPSGRRGGEGLGGLPGGPGRSVAHLRRLDEVELLGERVGIEQVAELVGVELEVTGAGEEGRKLVEIVAQTMDVEGLEIQRVGQDLDDQLVVFLREGPRLPGVALLDHGAIELERAGELAGVVVGTVALVAPGTALLESLTELRGQRDRGAMTALPGHGRGPAVLGGLGPLGRHGRQSYWKASIGSNAPGRLAVRH